MAGLDRAPDGLGGLSPVRVPVSGRSGWLALALIAAALTAMVGLSLLAGTGGGSGPQAVAEASTPSATGSSPARSSRPSPSRSPRTARPTITPDPPLGTPPPRVAVAVGSTRACPPDSTPDSAGPADQERPVADMPRMAFDRRSGRIILLATGPEVWETWAFDVCTNTWQQMRPERQPGPGEDGRFVIQLVYDADSDLTIGIFTDGSVWAYDDEADAWTEHGTTPEPGPFRLVYDPVSGLIVVQWIEDLHRALWTFDVETDSWTPITGPGAPPLGADRDHGLLAYDGSIDRLVAYNGLSYGTRLFDLRTGAWSATATFTPLVNTGWFASGGEIAYDEAREQTVVFSDGLVIAYRAREDRWEVLDGQPGSYPNSPTARMGHWMVYDSSNERLVVIGGGHRLSSGWVEADDVLGFDPTSREWIVLVEPLNVRPVDP